MRTWIIAIAAVAVLCFLVIWGASCAMAAGSDLARGQRLLIRVRGAKRWVISAWRKKDHK